MEVDVTNKSTVLTNLRLYVDEETITGNEIMPLNYNANDSIIQEPISVMTIAHEMHFYDLNACQEISSATHPVDQSLKLKDISHDQNFLCSSSDQEESNVAIKCEEDKDIVYNSHTEVTLSTAEEYILPGQFNEADEENSDEREILVTCESLLEQDPLKNAANECIKSETDDNDGPSNSNFHTEETELIHDSEVLSEQVIINLGNYWKNNNGSSKGVDAIIDNRVSEDILCMLDNVELDEPRTEFDKLSEGLTRCVDNSSEEISPFGDTISESDNQLNINIVHCETLPLSEVRFQCARNEPIEDKHASEGREFTLNNADPEINTKLGVDIIQRGTQSIYESKHKLIRNELLLGDADTHITTDISLLLGKNCSENDALSNIEIVCCNTQTINEFESTFIGNEFLFEKTDNLSTEMRSPLPTDTGLETSTLPNNKIVQYETQTSEEFIISDVIQKNAQLNTELFNYGGQGVDGFECKLIGNKLSCEEISTSNEKNTCTNTKSIKNSFSNTNPERDKQCNVEITHCNLTDNKALLTVMPFVKSSSPLNNTQPNIKPFHCEILPISEKQKLNGQANSEIQESENHLPRELGNDVIHSDGDSEQNPDMTLKQRCDFSKITTIIDTPTEKDAQQKLNLGDCGESSYLLSNQLSEKHNDFNNDPCVNSILEDAELKEKKLVQNEISDFVQDFVSIESKVDSESVIESDIDPLSNNKNKEEKTVFKSEIQCNSFSLQATNGTEAAERTILIIDEPILEVSEPDEDIANETLGGAIETTNEETKPFAMFECYSNCVKANVPLIHILYSSIGIKQETFQVTEPTINSGLKVVSSVKNDFFSRNPRFCPLCKKKFRKIYEAQKHMLCHQMCGRKPVIFLDRIDGDIVKFIPSFLKPKIILKRIEDECGKLPKDGIFKLYNGEIDTFDDVEIIETPVECIEVYDDDENICHPKSVREVTDDIQIIDVSTKENMRTNVVDNIHEETHTVIKGIDKQAGVSASSECPNGIITCNATNATEDEICKLLQLQPRKTIKRNQSLVESPLDVSYTKENIISGGALPKSVSDNKVCKQDECGCDSNSRINDGFSNNGKNLDNEVIKGRICINEKNTYNKKINDDDSTLIVQFVASLPHNNINKSHSTEDLNENVQNINVKRAKLSNGTKKSNSNPNKTCKVIDSRIKPPEVTITKLLDGSSRLVEKIGNYKSLNEIITLGDNSSNVPPQAVVEYNAMAPTAYEGKACRQKLTDKVHLIVHKTSHLKNIKNKFCSRCQCKQCKERFSNDIDSIKCNILRKMDNKLRYRSANNEKNKFTNKICIDMDAQEAASMTVKKINPQTKVVNKSPILNKILATTTTVHSELDYALEPVKMKNLAGQVPVQNIFWKSTVPNELDYTVEIIPQNAPANRTFFSAADMMPMKRVSGSNSKKNEANTTINSVIKSSRNIGSVQTLTDAELNACARPSRLKSKLMSNCAGQIPERNLFGLSDVHGSIPLGESNFRRMMDKSFMGIPENVNKSQQNMSVFYQSSLKPVESTCHRSRYDAPNEVTPEQYCKFNPSHEFNNDARPMQQAYNVNRNAKCSPSYELNNTAQPIQQPKNVNRIAVFPPFHELNHATQPMQQANSINRNAVFSPSQELINVVHSMQHTNNVNRNAVFPLSHESNNATQPMQQSNNVNRNAVFPLSHESNNATQPMQQSNNVNRNIVFSPFHESNVTQSVQQAYNVNKYSVYSPSHKLNNAARPMEQANNVRNAVFRPSYELNNAAQPTEQANNVRNAVFRPSHELNNAAPPTEQANNVRNAVFRLSHELNNTAQLVQQPNTVNRDVVFRLPEKLNNAALPMHQAYNVNRNAVFRPSHILNNTAQSTQQVSNDKRDVVFRPSHESNNATRPMHQTYSVNRNAVFHPSHESNNAALPMHQAYNVNRNAVFHPSHESNNAALPMHEAYDVNRNAVFRPSQELNNTAQSMQQANNDNRDVVFCPSDELNNAAQQRLSLFISQNGHHVLVRGDRTAPEPSGMLPYNHQETLHMTQRDTLQPSLSVFFHENSPNITSFQSNTLYSGSQVIVSKQKPNDCGSSNILQPQAESSIHNKSEKHKQTGRKPNALNGPQTVLSDTHQDERKETNCSFDCRTAVDSPLQSKNIGTCQPDDDMDVDDLIPVSIIFNSKDEAVVEKRKVSISNKKSKAVVEKRKIQISKEIEIFQCSFCDKTFVSEAALQKHRESPPTECTICDCAFCDVQSLANHNKNVHDELFQQSSA